MGQKLLVIDDNQDIADLLQGEFTSAGFEARCAYTGREALQALEAGFLPDLILLDVRMPVMDGSKFLDELERTKPEILRTVPILFSSAGNPPLDPRVRGSIDKMTDLSDYSARIRLFLTTHSELAS